MSDRNIDYRVIRRESEDGSDEWYSIQEVYYDGEKPSAYTIDLQVEGDTITGMRTQLEKMLKAIEMTSASCSGCGEPIASTPN